MSFFTLIGAGVSRFGQKVRREGQAEVFATIVDEFENVSARDGNSFSWTIVPYNSGNGDTIILVQNNHDELLLHLTEARIKTDADSALVGHFTDETTLTPTGTAITGTPWNRKLGNVAEANAFATETNNTQGTLNQIFFNEEIIADIGLVINLHGAVILGKGQSAAFDLATGSTALCSAAFEGFYAINDTLRN